MSSFSERMGFKPIISTMQVKSMNQALRNRLWNNFDVYFDDLIYIFENEAEYIISDYESFIELLWDSHFKVPFDTVSFKPKNVRQIIRELYFKIEWYEVYDLMEYFAEHYPDQGLTQNFIEKCNKILEEEVSGYRFIGNKIAPIISKEEISEIEEALSAPFTPVNTHLSTALTLLSDRESPDYRNSIKESISAVESICNLITGDKNLSLGQCLNKIKDKIPIHRALRRSFSSLYGYTSSAEGIRHALLVEANLEFEDAKFMLVSCSAFINYLKVKSTKAGITF